MIWKRAKAKFIARNPHLNNELLEKCGPLGVLPKFWKNFHRLLEFKMELSNEYGATHARTGPAYDGKSSLVVSTQDPVVIKHILKTHADNYLKGPLLVSLLKPMLGRGIFNINHGPHASDNGDLWYFQRKVASKMFTRRMFTGQLYEALCKNSVKVAKTLENANGKRVDLKPLCYKFTLDSIGTVGFGIDLKSLDEPGQLEFEEAFDAAVHLTIKSAMLPFRKYIGFMHPIQRTLKAKTKVLDRFCYRVIDERLRDLKVASKSDVLSLFISEIRSKGPRSKQLFCNKQEEMTFFRDAAMNFLVAGRDTTACTLSFVFYLLALHPDKQQLLYEEIKSEAPEDGTPPTQIQLKSGFQYLKAVVNETLRMYPPVPSDSKMTVEDDIIPDAQGGPLCLPAGCRVIFEPYLMGRNENLWGKDANEFKPERWLGENKANPSEFEMPTFQPGKRVCLGQDLAKYESYVFTVELIRRFHFELDRPVFEVPYQSGVTLSLKGDLPVIATSR